MIEIYTIMRKKSFKSFLEEEEQKSYISSLQDELGISPEDMESEPQIASFFSLGGKFIDNIGSYKIIKFQRNEDGKITHAVVKQINDSNILNRRYKEKKDKILRVDAPKENETFLVKIEDLDKLLSQDFQPPAQGNIV